MSAHMRYPAELRERAVKLYRSTRPRPTFRHLGEQLGVHPEALRGWVRADQAARGDKPTRSSPAGKAAEDGVLIEEMEAELLTLRRENAELKRANEILKVASAFFAQQLDPIRR